MVEFYKKAMPQAKVDKNDERTIFHWDSFPGAEPGEYIEIAVRKGEIHIAECLKKGKHKGH